MEDANGVYGLLRYDSVPDQLQLLVSADARNVGDAARDAHHPFGEGWVEHTSPAGADHGWRRRRDADDSFPSADRFGVDTPILAAVSLSGREFVAATPVPDFQSRVVGVGRSVTATMGNIGSPELPRMFGPPL
ncbi:hypothetical protein [Amycolatopsis sp. NPDC021455]|uniref:hypothetical protein n=1 Tax=Amycolatopsis sp. NPDC021455 TaxID=3154901 RepID=UPI0033D5B0A6